MNYVSFDATLEIIKRGGLECFRGGSTLFTTFGTLPRKKKKKKSSIFYEFMTQPPLLFDPT